LKKNAGKGKEDEKKDKLKGNSKLFQNLPKKDGSRFGRRSEDQKKAGKQDQEGGASKSRQQVVVFSARGTTTRQLELSTEPQPHPVPLNTVDFEFPRGVLSRVNCTFRAPASGVYFIQGCVHTKATSKGFTNLYLIKNGEYERTESSTGLKNVGSSSGDDDVAARISQCVTTLSLMKANDTMQFGLRGDQPAGRVRIASTVWHDTRFFGTLITGSETVFAMNNIKNTDHRMTGKV
jgi:hypothetical protein